MGSSPPPKESGNFEGSGASHCKICTLWSSVEKRLNRSRCRLGCGLGWAQGIITCVRWGSRGVRDVTMATIFWLSIHGVHIEGWRVRVRRRCAGCGLMSNYFDHLLWSPYGMLPLYFHPVVNCCSSSSFLVLSQPSQIGCLPYLHI